MSSGNMIGRGTEMHCRRQRAPVDHDRRGLAGPVLARAEECAQVMHEGLEDGGVAAQ